MKFLTFLKTKFDHIFNGQFSNNQDVVKEEINREIEKASVKLGQMNFAVSNYVQFVNGVIKALHRKCLIILLPMM